MTALGGTIRSFIAIELPPEVLDSLATTQHEVQRRLGPAGRSLRWTRPECIHLTLQFLGEVRISLIGPIAVAMEKAAHGIRTFTLQTDMLGVFPNPRRPRVLWVGLRGDLEVLKKLNDATAEQLKPLGFAPDQSFSPHLTLARVREDSRPDDRAAVAALVAPGGQPAARPVTFDVQGVSLMRSELSPGGSIYTEQKYVKLAGGAASRG
jgi:2'-5' RNA ligase